MKTTILQVPIDVKLRDAALVSAENMGFSSLQDVIRLFIKKLANRTIDIRFDESVQLSPKAIKRYNKMLDEIDSGKVKLESYSDVDSLMKSLAK